MTRVEGIELVVKRLNLAFKKPAKTSRDTLHSKPSWIIVATDNRGHSGWGECSLIPGLSVDDPLEIEQMLSVFQRGRYLDLEEIPVQLPALRMATEMVLLGLEHLEHAVHYEGGFVRGKTSLTINGLIWMDEVDGLIQQAEQLISSGHKTLKMKVGSMPFEQELSWLSIVREMAPASEGYTIRVDANGAFSEHESGWTPLQKLEALANFEVHSIEQPLRVQDRKGLAEMSQQGAVPIALDESLIGMDLNEVHQLLDAIQPAFLVLKPSLLGGFSHCQQIISSAENQGIRWWVTSALESNIGLNAIAQWTSDGIQSAPNPLPQGLGTGGLFQNNIEGPLLVENGQLRMQQGVPWMIQSFLQ